MQRFGVRKIIIFALALMSASPIASLWMTAPRQLILVASAMMFKERCRFAASSFVVIM